MRAYRIIVAATEAGLIAAKGNWTILGNTVREFSRLASHDDHSLGDIGSVLVEREGFVCLAYREA